MTTKKLFFVAAAFFLFFLLSSAKPAKAAGVNCSADKPYEIVPGGATCGDTLFLWGNNYRLCATNPFFPAPALGSRNESWYWDRSSFSSGSVLYNSDTYTVPPGGVYLCDSNVFGCNNSACKGQGAGQKRDCQNPRDGDKDTGCYGTTLRKDSPDDKKEDWTDILNPIVRTFFNWGGLAQKIEIENLKIPIEGDLKNLLGFFPGGTPGIINDDAMELFENGTLPKLTPPGPPLEELQQNLFSYIEDFGKGELEPFACSAQGHKNPSFGVPDIWGLRNAGLSLFSFMARLPGEDLQVAYEDRIKNVNPDLALNTDKNGKIIGGQENLLSQAEAETCKNKTREKGDAATVTKTSPTEKLTQNTTQTTAPNISLTANPPSSSCYGPGGCPNKTDAPEKDICLTNDSYGLIGDPNDPNLPVPEEGASCPITPGRQEKQTCSSIGQIITCPDGTAKPMCSYIGEPFWCDIPPVIPDCNNPSSTNMRMPPKISFLPEYTASMIQTYSIFKLPGVQEKDLFGEGLINWKIGGFALPGGQKDDKALYPKLGTVECMEDMVRRTLNLPGHDIAPKPGCFE